MPPVSSVPALTRDFGGGREPEGLGFRVRGPGSGVRGSGLLGPGSGGPGVPGVQRAEVLRVPPFRRPGPPAPLPGRSNGRPPRPQNCGPSVRTHRLEAPRHGVSRCHARSCVVAGAGSYGRRTLCKQGPRTNARYEGILNLSGIWQGNQHIPPSPPSTARFFRETPKPPWI